MGLALSLGLGACGGSEADSLASESCDLLKSIDLDAFEDAADIAASGEEASMANLEKLAEFGEKAEALEKKAKDAGVSEAELEKAVKAECADEVEKLESFVE